jgi:hypothetical protein
LRAAAVIPPRRFFGAAWAGALSGFFGGRPRRFVPWSSAIARLSLSRSATRSAMICSVGISSRCYHEFSPSIRHRPVEVLHKESAHRSEDISLIRAGIMKDHLAHALLDSRGDLARKVAREFSRYFGWFAESIPPCEREAIRVQLSKLERQIAQQRCE